MNLGKMIVGGLIGFLLVGGLVGWIFFSGVDWSELDPRTEAERAAAKAAALVEWQRNQEIHSLVVTTVFSADLGNISIRNMPLEARLEIAGAENLSEVCHRMPYVFEAILRTLTEHASEVVDSSGKLNLASQDRNIQDAINDVFKKGAVRRVRLASLNLTSQRPKTGKLCQRADKLLAESEARPD